MNKASLVRLSIWKRVKNYFERQWHNGIVFNLCSLVFFLWAISLVAVLIWGFGISLTDGRLFSLGETGFFPEEWKWENYSRAFKTITVAGNSYGKMVINSIWYATGNALSQLLATLFFAYAIARFEFKGRKLLYGFVLLQLMLPVYGGSVSNYKLLSDLHIIDTPFIIIANCCGTGMYFLITHSFFSTLPKSYDEAAAIDGAGYMRTCFQIIMPLAKPIIVSVGFMLFMGYWTDYGSVLLYLPSWPTLMSGLYRYKTVAIYTLDTAVYFAGVFVATFPVMLIFIIFNKTLMENVTIGGIKG